MTCGAAPQAQHLDHRAPALDPRGVGDSQRERSRSPVQSYDPTGHPGPATADRYLNFLDHLPHISWRTCVADLLADHRRLVPSAVTARVCPVSSRLMRLWEGIRRPDRPRAPI